MTVYQPMANFICCQYKKNIWLYLSKTKHTVHVRLSDSNLSRLVLYFLPLTWDMCDQNKINEGSFMWFINQHICQTDHYVANELFPKQRKHNCTLIGRFIDFIEIYSACNLTFYLYYPCWLWWQTLIITWSCCIRQLKKKQYRQTPNKPHLVPKLKCFAPRLVVV